MQALKNASFFLIGEEMGTKVKKIFNIIFSVLTGILLLFTFIFLIKGIKANKEQKIPEMFGYKYSTVPTGSMLPVIQIGDLIIIKNVDYDLIEREDIIVFRDENLGINIVHRVIRIEEDGLVTQGDNNDVEDDGHVTAELFEGKVVKIIPKVGNLVLSYRKLIFAAVIIVFVFIIITEVINIIKTVNDSRREKLEEELNDKYKDYDINLEKEEQ